MSKWFLLEDVQDGLIQEQGEILALRPEACFRLDSLGIPYRIIEDFYDEKDLFNKNDAYFHRQLQWFKDFDAFIKLNVPLCEKENIEAASSHYYQLSFFIDSVVIFSYALEAFFRKAQPSSIHYVGRKYRLAKESSIYTYPVNDIDFFGKVVACVCQDRRIAFTCDSLGSPGFLQPAARSSAKAFMNALGGKAFLWFYKYRKYMRFFKRQDRKFNAMFLHAGVESMDQVLKELVPEAKQLYFKDKERIYDIGDIFQRCSLDMRRPLGGEKAQLGRDCTQAAAALTQRNPLIAWVNGECGIDVSTVVLPFLKFFLERICFETLAEQERIGSFLRQKKIKFVFTRSGSERQVIPSLIAAAKAKVKRVCFQHGCSPLDFLNWHITELCQADIYYASDTEAKRYFTDCLKYDYMKQAKVFESSHYLRSIKKSGKKSDVSTVMFVPHRVFFGFRCLNNYCYPITWYYNLQKALIDCFGRRKDTRFIYKLGAHQFWVENTLIEYISQKDYSNILVERRNFVQCIDLAGKICFDYPSTALYEAAMLGIPVMSLCPDFLPVWQPAIDDFGKSIKKFSTINEALVKMEEFLDGNGEEFIPKVATEENDFLETLRTFAST